MRVARHGLVDVELEAAPADPQCGDLVVEVGPIRDAPADPWPLDARGGGEHSADRAARPRGGEAQDAAPAAVEIVAERRAHRLHHATARARRAAERDFCEEGVMDVAAEQADRCRRIAAPPGGDLLEQAGEALEGVLEGCPVLEIEVAAHAFAPARGPLAPGAVADRL